MAKPLATSIKPFISYYPLKQGLKLFSPISRIRGKITFISYYPLKQGLKLLFLNASQRKEIRFISYYPLKQGLKLQSGQARSECPSIYILLSIKTRIETAVRASTLRVPVDLYPTIH